MTNTDLAGSTPRSLRALVGGLVDYAGLFPPAQLGMDEAVRNYAEYLAGPYAWILGRFVLPVSRLAEFDSVSPDVLPRGEGSSPWRIAALAGDDPAADAQEALKFNCRHWSGSELGHAVIDTVEIRTTDDTDHAKLRECIPDFFTVYMEVAASAAVPAALDAISRAGARAKIRMGGVTPDAFPAAAAVVAFLSGCAARSLPFKATAGLHHAVRAEYPLTYERDSACAPMYGFLNLFLAAVALRCGASEDLALAILTESDRSLFTFDDLGAAWSGRWSVTTADIARARELATSFGSCSFREPVDELVAAGLLR